MKFSISIDDKSIELTDIVFLVIFFASYGEYLAEWTWVSLAGIIVSVLVLARRSIKRLFNGF